MARVKNDAAATAAPTQVAAAAPTPDVGGRPRGGAPLPRVPPSPGYYFAWHPDRWHVMRGRVVPMLRKITLQPGANGVDRDPRGRPVPTLALAQAEQDGWTVLPWDVDGPGTSYLKPTGTGGWVSRWETLYGGSDRIGADEDGFAKWCDGLVSSGKVPAPLDYVLARIEDELVSRIGRYRDSSRSGTSSKIKRLEADLEAVLGARQAVQLDPVDLEPAVPPVGL